MSTIPEEIKAIGFLAAKAEPTPYQYKPKPLAKLDVDFHVTYNGICHTDIHNIDNDWGIARYPLVPGHEVVGHVIGVGADVTEFKVGDVVGLGALCQACGKCEWCNKKLENFCVDRRFTYGGDTTDETGNHPHHGGFGSFIRTDSRLLFKIPEGYSEAHAGPMLCAGVTVSAPLQEYLGGFDATGKKIGVLGLGGLGHLGVQFAAKMGAETIVLSRGTSKKEYAKQLGASGFIDTTNADELKAAAGSFDFVLVCQSGGAVNVNVLAGLLRPYGHLHLVGIPSANLDFSAVPLIFGRQTIAASLVGSAQQMRDMLAFAAKHDIKPEIEIFPHSKAAEALKKVRDGTIRFRAVLKNDLA